MFPAPTSPDSAPSCSRLGARWNSGPNPMVSCPFLATGDVHVFPVPRTASRRVLACTTFTFRTCFQGLASFVRAPTILRQRYPYVWAGHNLLWLVRFRTFLVSFKHVAMHTAGLGHRLHAHSNDRTWDMRIDLHLDMDLCFTCCCHAHRLQIHAHGNERT